MEKLLMTHSNIDDLVSDLVSHPADFGNLKLSYPMAYSTAESNKQSPTQLTGDIPDSYPNYYPPTSTNGLATSSAYPDDPMVYNQNSENEPFESLPTAEHVFNVQSEMPNQSIGNLPAVYSHPLDQSIAYNRPAFGYPPVADSIGLPANLQNSLQNVTNLNALNMSFGGLRMSNSSPRNTIRMQNNNSPQYGLSHNFNGHRRPNGGHHLNHYQNNNSPNRRPMQKKTNNQSNRFPMNQQNYLRISPNSNYNAACNVNYDPPPQMSQRSNCNQIYPNDSQFDFSGPNCCDTMNKCDPNSFSMTDCDAAADRCDAANCCASHSQCHYKTGHICEFGLNCCATKDFICNSNVKIDFRRNTFDLSKYNLGGNRPADRHSPGLLMNRSSAQQKQANERPANLRSFRPSNKNKQSKLVCPSPDLSLVIEKCFDQLNELRKERIRLSKLPASPTPSSTPTFKQGKTSVGDVVKFAMDEHKELAKWFDDLHGDHGQSTDPANEILQTSYYSYQLWFASIQSIDYAYRRSLVKLDEHKINASSLFDANVERVNDSSDLQCQVQLQQVPRTTKEVRKSLWCLSIIRADDF